MFAVFSGGKTCRSAVLTFLFSVPSVFAPARVLPLPACTGFGVVHLFLLRDRPAHPGTLTLALGTEVAAAEHLTSRA